MNYVRGAEGTFPIRARELHTRLRGKSVPVVDAKEVRDGKDGAGKMENYITARPSG